MGHKMQHSMFVCNSAMYFYNISVISVVNECCSKIEIATDENCGEEWVTCLKKTNQVM